MDKKNFKWDDTPNRYRLTAFPIAKQIKKGDQPEPVRSETIPGYLWSDGPGWLKGDFEEAKSILRKHGASDETHIPCERGALNGH